MLRLGTALRPEFSASSPYSVVPAGLSYASACGALRVAGRSAALLARSFLPNRRMMVLWSGTWPLGDAILPCA